MNWNTFTSSNISEPIAKNHLIPCFGLGSILYDFERTVSRWETGAVLPNNTKC